MQTTQAIKVDPITLEIVQGTVESARKEMEMQVERTARSIIIRERRDYRAAVFDKYGRNVSSASSAAFIDPIANYYGDDVNDGDVFIWNDPFKSAGGITHLPDICITQPVFFEGKLAGYVQVFGHVLDIGGIVPGSIAIGATDIFHEGIIIPPIKIYERGKVVEPAYRLIVNNSRFPEDLRGDLDAEIMACRVGARRFIGLLELYGQEVVDAALEQALEGCAIALRERVLPLIPVGRWEFEDFVEINGAVPSEPRPFIRLKVALENKGDGHITFDFSGTDKQSQAAINVAGNEKYYVKYLMSIFRPIIPDVILNSGALRVIDVILEKGTVYSSQYPASCSFRAVSLFRVPEICQGALVKAMGGNAAAGADTRSPWRYTGVHEGKSFLVHDGVGGGSGGRPTGDGIDAISGDVQGTSVPVEYLESFYPLRVEKYQLARDSGGAGTHRGGFGIHKDVRLLAPGSLWIFNDRQVLQPWGVAGGLAGEGTTFAVNLGGENEQKIDYKATNVKVVSGDLLTIRTPGGGGWGDPLERDPNLVALETREGFISPESARNDYGVVAEGLTVDVQATAAARTAIRGSRGPRRMIDRGEGFRNQERLGRISLTTSDD